MSVLTGLLNLQDSASEAQITEAVQSVLRDRDRIKAENESLTAEIDRHNNEKREAQKVQAVSLTDAAIKDGRLDARGRDGMLALFDKDFDSAKAMLESIPQRQSVSAMLGQQHDTALSDIRDKSWDELDKAGRLLELKDKAPDLYKEKFKARFGVEPKL